MRATISKDFTFSASHHLEGLPKTHPCSRVHGHNYTVRVTVTGEVDPVGFVVDYRELGFVKDYLDGELDHRHLNEVVDFNPTAEHLAHHLWTKVVAGLTDYGTHDVSVSVSETPKTWATVWGVTP